MNVRRKAWPLPMWSWALAGVAGLFNKAFRRDAPDERLGVGEAVETSTTEKMSALVPGGGGVEISPGELAAFTDVRTRGGRRGLVATAAAAVFAVLGATAIGLAFASQQHAPQPPPSATGSIRPAPGSLAIPAARPTRQPASNVVGPVLPPSKPVALDIPAIGVHSRLLYLGETAGDTLEVPPPGPHYNEAAWYKYSPTPGSLGPAIILGHVDSAAEGPSVFFNLGDLRPGDSVLVTRADGLAAVFRVDDVRWYPKDRFPTHLVYGNTDHAALRLVTCGGPFDFATGHYLENIVVFASLRASHEA